MTGRCRLGEIRSGRYLTLPRSWHDVPFLLSSYPLAVLRQAVAWRWQTACPSFYTCLPNPPPPPIPIYSHPTSVAFLLFYLLTLAAYLAHSYPCRSVFQTQIWTDALGSVALKCISRKILPFRERVIFQKKRRKLLVRQSLEASVNPERFRQKKNRTKGRKTNH